MKPLYPVILVTILTSACSMQQKKQPQPKEPQLISKQEMINMQETTAIKTDVVNKSQAVPPLSEVLGAKTIAKRPVEKLKPLTIPKSSTAKIKKKPKSNQVQPPSKTVTNLNKNKTSSTNVQAESVKGISQFNEMHVPQPAPKKRQKTVTITEETLPIRFGSSWTLDINHDQSSNNGRCYLTSNKRKFYDGHDNASMYLRLTSSALLVKTDSKIDLSYPGVGIYIDQNNAFLFDQIINESHVVTKTNITAITARLIEAKRVTIKLGFWPTWPKTETASIDFALQDFDKAFQALKTCESL